MDEDAEPGVVNGLFVGNSFPPPAGNRVLALSLLDCGRLAGAEAEVPRGSSRVIPPPPPLLPLIGAEWMFSAAVVTIGARNGIIASNDVTANMYV
jgi:hypothetical protein